MTHPFEEVNRRLDVDRDIQNDLQLENNLVNRLLVRTYASQAGEHRQQIYSECNARILEKRLTFALFHELFPDYPVLMAFSRLDGLKLHTDPRSTLPSILKEFWRTPFFQHYALMAETQENRRDGLKIGLVFPRHGLKYGLVLHNGGLAFKRRRDTVVVHDAGDEDSPVLLGVQTFDSMIDAIATKFRE